MLAWEDTDYVWRLQLAGHRLRFVSDAMFTTGFLIA